MYNTQSPIVNNMMLGGNGGIHQPGCIPSNPIGNILPIGSNGYNNGNSGGYYNGVYNNYNPYLVAQQMQIQQTRLKEQQRCQSDVYKNISRCVNKALGNEITEEHLQQYDIQDNFGPQSYTPEQQEDMMTVRLLNVNQNGINGNIYNARLIQANNAHFDMVKQQYPDDISTLEFSERFTDIYVDMLKDKNKVLEKNLSTLYDSNRYNQLINMHKSDNNYFAGTFRQNTGNSNVSIDDMEVKLPMHMQNEYHSRRQAFLNSIIGG